MSNILLTNGGATGCASDPLCLGGEFTIDFWFKVHDADDPGVLFNITSSNCDDLLIAYIGSGVYGMDLDNDGVTTVDAQDRGIWFSIAGGPDGSCSGFEGAVQTPNLQADVWYHLALTRDLNNMVRAFWNGEFALFLTKPDCLWVPTLPPPTIAGNLSLSGGKLGEGEFTGYPEFCGSIDEFRIVKGSAQWCEDFTPPIIPHNCVMPSNCDPSLAGCTDPTANNYNPLATSDDSSCQAGGGGAAAASSEDSTGTTVGTYALTHDSTPYYYWHLEDVCKRTVNPQGGHTAYHAWSYTEDGEGVDLYVIDTGVNSLHPMLQAATGGSRVNDVPGYNGLWNGSVYTNEPPSNTGLPDGTRGHGTYCSLLAGGGSETENATGGEHGPGVAKKLNIWALRVMSENGGIYNSDILDAIDAVIGHNTVGGANYKNTTRPSIINLSLSSGVPNYVTPTVYEDVQGERSDTADEVGDALKQAAYGNSGTSANPIHIVMAAGNGFASGYGGSYGPMDARYNFPRTSQPYSTFDGTGTATFATDDANNDPGQGLTISSGATRRANLIENNELETASFTNYGSAVTIFGPGSELFCPNWAWTSSAPTTADITDFETSLSGTSFSSPITAGLLALRLSDKTTDEPAAGKTWLADSTTGGGNIDQIDGTGTYSSGLMTPVNCPGTCTGNGPLQFTVGSINVTLTTGAHTLEVTNVIQINSVTETPTSGAANEVWPGNVTADQINGWHTITAIGADHVIFQVTGLNPTDIANNVGSTDVQYALVTGMHEEDDGVVYTGTTLQLVPDSGSNVNIKYTPVPYSDNLYLYNPYQQYTTSWTQSESLTGVAVSDTVCLALNATMTVSNTVAVDVYGTGTVTVTDATADKAISDTITIVTPSTTIVATCVAGANAGAGTDTPSFQYVEDDPITIASNLVAVLNQHAELTVTNADAVTTITQVAAGSGTSVQYYDAGAGVSMSVSYADGSTGGPASSSALDEVPFSCVMTFDSGTLPTGLTYVPTTGVLSGTVTVAGTYVFTMAATNGYWNAKRRFTMVVT